MKPHAAAYSLMKSHEGRAVDVVLPKNSLTMTEAEIIEWYVEEGGEVVAGQPLFVMETEKSQVDVEAAKSGRLTEIRCQPGTVAAAGEVIAVVDTGEPDTSFTGSTGPARAVAPAAAELAEQLGIDIDTVRGSGTGGRVLEDDVLKAVTQTPAGTNVPAGTSQPASRPAEFSKARIAGNRATVAAAAVPVFHLSVQVPLPRSARPDGATASDLLVAAAATAARKVPVANAFADDEHNVRLYEQVRVGLLVRDRDALVPLVFADPDQAGLDRLHAQRREWMAQVGNGSLPTEAISWPTLVVSNIGRPSVGWFSAVLFPATSVTIAVGGLGARQPRQAEVVLTCDHRVLDGVDAAQFAEAFTDALAAL
jgi:pyruvate dehydrogenase E2 component (dihydrolipoamide acetyltransferase)